MVVSQCTFNNRAGGLYLLYAFGGFARALGTCRDVRRNLDFFEQRAPGGIKGAVTE